MVKGEPAVRYVSTRGGAPVLEFEDVLLAGLATDGGLYVPETWPQFSTREIRALRGRSYPDLAARIMAPFVGDAFTAEELSALAEDSYRGFTHPATAPLVQIGPDRWILELFHGPTIAFKDYALQVLGRLFDAALARRGQRVTVVGATSGDTGSAAIEACRDRANIDVFILHPHGRTSDVQRRQMTTVASANVFNIALEGAFDDCQTAVKAMFGDAGFRDRMRLTAVNSINWARIMAQIVYYFWAALSRGGPDRPVAFSVPTGNFGNVFAAYAATRMGLPIERLVVGSNANDILDRFFRTGEMRTAPVVETLSPSMDIQISSNFERLLFELHGRDGAAVAAQMAAFKTTGRFQVTADQAERARSLFTSHRLDDGGITEVIRTTRTGAGYLIDPHTAVGLAAAQAQDLPPGVPMVALACAHPAKFPDAVETASGIRPPLPRHLTDLYDRAERMVVLPDDQAGLQSYIAAHSRAARN